MKRAGHIACALVSDALVGDPRWFPHPAKLTGRLALRLEQKLRPRIRNERLAGAVTVGAVTGSAALATLLLTGGVRRWRPWAGDLVSIAILCTTLAARDLADHALAVQAALEAGDLEAACALVGRMVGRDVATLDEDGVVRAAVESVAENTVDGVTGPLFYAYLGGPAAAAAYKAISTLDSTFGYHNERYERFGWAAARADDLVNLLPARLTVGATFVAAGLLGLRPLGVLAVCARDGRKHPSPNSGWAEAAMAGALGVQLGGPLSREGRIVAQPTLGDALEPLTPAHIRPAVRMMVVTTAVWNALLAAGAALLRGRGLRSQAAP